VKVLLNTITVLVGLSLVAILAVAFGGCVNCTLPPDFYLWRDLPDTRYTLAFEEGEYYTNGYEVEENWIVTTDYYEPDWEWDSCGTFCNGYRHRAHGYLKLPVANTSIKYSGGKR